MKKSVCTYLIILPRWFALPSALAAIVLGALLAEGITWQVVLAMLAGTIIMVGGHYYNSWADYIYGLDRGRPASVGKWYTSASMAVSLGLTTVRKELVGWITLYILSAILLIPIVLTIHSPWPWLGWGIGVTTATIYSPGFCKGVKHLGFPEYCGIGGFGIGGCLLGYAVSSGSVSFIPVICGIAISLFWGLSWAVDQFPDAESDYHKGVRNLGTIIAVTHFPIALYYLPAMLFAYVFLMFVINLGYLSPWTFLSALALPLFTLTAIWITKSQDKPESPDFEKGVKYGLLGIFLAMVLVCIGQIIGG